MDGAGPATDAEAFDAFYARTRDRLAVQVAALTGDPVEALDHVQEAFIRAWGRWSRVGRLDDPEGWVRRVAHNLAVSRWRRARRTVLGDRPDGAVPGWDDDQGAVLAALAHLPRPEREAIVLHHLVGLSVAEIAAELRAPSGTVKSWLARGRARLATHLNAVGEDRTEEMTQ
ncbi:SigE family RNA polymerase sigma factor [uncultured Jatrophihabitans sp.]|uniref:SigE family RNA polymerase sigma factor n=1 Tax=uncultured Jatrophihabitans sp. TaxID=1610747 RepID=UPI0035CB325E